MNSNEDKPLTINIYKNNTKDIESSQNKSETYIILANEELNNKLREQNNNISNLEEQINILENDNERMEKSITYQRGLLHNFNHLRNYEQDKCILYSDMIDVYKKIIFQLENKNKKLLMINKYNIIALLSVISLCLLTSLIEYYDFNILTFIIVCFTYYCNAFIFNNNDNIDKTLKTSINDINKNIKNKNNDINKITIDTA